MPLKNNNVQKDVFTQITRTQRDIFTNDMDMVAAILSKKHDRILQNEVLIKPDYRICGNILGWSDGDSTAIKICKDKLSEHANIEVTHNSHIEWSEDSETLKTPTDFKNRVNAIFNDPIVSKTCTIVEEMPKKLYPGINLRYECVVTDHIPLEMSQSFDFKSVFTKKYDDLGKRMHTLINEMIFNPLQK